MKRLYEYIVESHFSDFDQAVFLCGPRQVGKTTIAKNLQKTHKHHAYWNWDNINDRENILAGPKALEAFLPLQAELTQRPLLTLDEIHKYSDWKTLVKGIIDTYKGSLDLLVTGSAKLDVFRKKGDSMMGRYFLYHVHPVSVAELLRQPSTTDLIMPPQQIDPAVFDSLFQLGGFPEPFLKGTQHFARRWQNLRKNQFFREDLRELAQIQEIALLETLAYFIQQQSGQLVNYTNLASKVRVSDQTIRRWLTVFESIYYCFTLKPWSKNISRSLLKEPKVYLWDWSTIEDKGQRIENFVASHLYKAAHYWTDMGMGTFELYFLRDKNQREVDFLMTKDDKPWLMVEVKSSLSSPLSPALLHFQNQLNANHVLQVAFDAPYVDVDCFSLKTPKIVPVSTFLSQLI